MSENPIKTINSDKLISAFASILLWLSIIAGIVLITLAGVVNNESDFDSYGENGFNLYFILSGFGAMVNGLFIFVLLKGFSDIIYLLKTQANPFDRH
jgi:vacuolar-type H+-ATPase subunit I/STV1